MSASSTMFATFLLNSLWQIPLVVAVTFLSTRLMRRASSAQHHIVWVAALCLCLALPLASVRISSEVSATSDALLFQPMDSPTAAASGPASLAHGRFSFVTRNHVRQVGFTPALFRIFLGFYIGFLIYRALKIAGAFGSTLAFRARSRARQLPETLAPIAKRYLAAFGLKDVAILCSPNALGPVTLSFRSPALILPTRFFTEVSEADFSCALCHELAHIRRHDFALNLIYEIISLPVSFHPAVVWLKNRIAFTRELACDEAAAGRLSSPSAYAKSLLSIAKSLLPGPHATETNWALGLFDTATLEDRIRNLVGKTKRSGRKWGIVLSVGILGLLTVTCAGISAFSLRVTPSAQSRMEVKPFIGTWTAVHQGTRFIVLELKMEKGALSGGMRICSFNLDMEGRGRTITIVNDTLTESLPARNFEIVGKSLRFDWTDPDGDETHWKLEPAENDAGHLTWIELPDGLSTQPIPVTKQPL